MPLHVQVMVFHGVGKVVILGLPLRHCISGE
jgi:hypothetical protein